MSERERGRWSRRRRVIGGQLPNAQRAVRSLTLPTASTSAPRSIPFTPPHISALSARPLSLFAFALPSARFSPRYSTMSLVTLAASTPLESILAIMRRDGGVSEFLISARFKALELQRAIKGFSASRGAELTHIRSYQGLHESSRGGSDELGGSSAVRRSQEEAGPGEACRAWCRLLRLGM